MTPEELSKMTDEELAEYMTELEQKIEEMLWPKSYVRPKIKDFMTEDHWDTYGIDHEK